jgi:hypothetical protein
MNVGAKCIALSNVDGDEFGWYRETQNASRPIIVDERFFYLDDRPLTIDHGQ